MNIVSMALLDGYKVRWSRETVARDVIQNFFDEVSDFGLVSIEVDHKARTVEVRGPSSFDLDYLKYIGATTKADPARRTAGGFGEGFKICALVLLRDYGVEIEAGSGDWEIRPFLREMKLGRELCYEVKNLEGDDLIRGSFVRLSGVDKLLRGIFDRGRDFFRHPDNPLLKKPIFVDEAAGIGVYEAIDSHRGDLFYRRQHRGYLSFSKGAGLTLAYDDRLKVLEEDRDRRNLKAARPVLRAVVRNLPDEILEKLIRRLRMYWQGGSGLLTILVDEGRRRGLRLTFSKRWLAKEKLGWKLHNHAERLGYHLAITKMAELGMPTVTDRFNAQTVPRSPTPLEAARILLAVRIFRQLMDKDPPLAKFQVVEIDDRLGRHSSNTKVATLKAQDLAGPFAEGISECLAAMCDVSGLLAHLKGDLLTSLLEGVLRNTDQLRAFADEWDALAEGDLPVSEEIMALDGSTGELPRAAAHLPIIILAPEGFPPALELQKTLENLSKEVGAHAMIHILSINNPRDAARHYARGVPSVWICRREVEPPPRPRVGYSLRVYTDEQGRASPVPSRAVLAQVVRREHRMQQKRGRRSRVIHAGPSDSQRINAWVRYLRRHDPEGYRAHLIDSAASDLYRQTEFPEEWPFNLSYSCHIKLITDLKSQDFEMDRLDERLKERFSELLKEMKGLVETLKQRVPGLISDTMSWSGRNAVSKISESIFKATQADRPFEQLALVLSPFAFRLAEAADQAPLDDSCKTACYSVAWKSFLESITQDEETTSDQALLEHAVDQAQELLDRGVTFALARHEEVDDYGRPTSCYNTGKELRKHFGLSSPTSSKEPTQLAQAVAAAWQEALAGGVDQIEASRHCLDIALEISLTQSSESLS